MGKQYGRFFNVLSEYVQGDKFQIDMQKFWVKQVDQQVRFIDVFFGESMQQMVECFGECYMLSYDFVIIERVDYYYEIQIGVLIKFVMDK